MNLNGTGRTDRQSQSELSQSEPSQSELSRSAAGGQSPTIADRPFTSDPATSHTLPARNYFDREIYEKEKFAIFSDAWVYVGHQSQVKDPGHYLTVSVAGQDLFVIRDRDGTIGGFYNVCQHRGHELLTGSGSTRAITCPYHAWVYGLDGSLRNARNASDSPEFNYCDFALSPVRVELLCGFIFVNLNNDAQALAEQAPGLADELRHYCPEIDLIEFAQRDVFDVVSNWKTMIDNFLECYHCAPAHRDFVDLVDMDSYRSVLNGIYSTHTSGVARTTESSAYSFTPGSVDFGYAGWFLWPNLTIWIYPGDANVSLLQMNPDEPEGTIEYQDWFCLNGTPSAQLAEAMAYQKDILQPEDISLCESVQRGLKSKGYNQGRFVVDDDRTVLSEHAVHHFQLLVAEAIGLPIEK